MAKKNAKPRRKEAKGESAQSFLPIRDIRNGMVETTDGRYLKILELSPSTLPSVPRRSSSTSSPALPAG